MACTDAVDAVAAARAWGRRVWGNRTEDILEFERCTWYVLAEQVPAGGSRAVLMRAAGDAGWRGGEVRRCRRGNLGTLAAAPCAMQRGSLVPAAPVVVSCLARHPGATPLLEGTPRSPACSCLDGACIGLDRGGQRLMGLSICWALSLRMPPCSEVKF